MAVSSVQFLLLTLSILAPAHCVDLLATPDEITPGFTSTLELACSIKNILSAVSQVFVIQIEKEDGGHQTPLATISSSGITLNNGNLNGRLHAVGGLDVKTAEGPFLNITLDHPGQKDAGHYICVVSVTDVYSKLVTLDFKKNVTFKDLTSDIVAQILANLNHQVSNLARKNGELAAQNADLVSRLNKLELDLENERKQNNFTDDLIERILVNVTSQLASSGSTNQGSSSCTACSSVTNEIQSFYSNQSLLANKIHIVETSVNQLSTNLILESESIKSLEQRYGTLEMITSEQYTEIAELQSFTNYSTIAFSAYMPKIEYTNTSVSSAHPGNLRFESKLVDTHNAYDTLTGAFVAPRAGYYLLSLSLSIYPLATNTAAMSIQAAIKVNSDVIAHGWTSTSGLGNQGAITVIKRLEQGDKTFVKVTQILNDPIALEVDACFFAGFYLGDH